ncbi:NADPH-dependent FMN reductase [Pseudonocardia sp. RS010]|uniref:NADPH-dependent FMN reductase n=1 Tax=Pseudonocardia sp. RS010 TaxID=3385979 RepID=UPI0039A07EEE
MTAPDLSTTVPPLGPEVTVGVVVGNPKPASRTLAAGSILAGKLAGRAPDAVVDLVELGGGLLERDDPDVRAAVEKVAGCDLVVVSCPTFKGTYTGLLKLFLDRFATAEGLAGVVAVPLMLGAGPAHGLAPDLLLKSVLVELGAVCPTPGLYLSDRTYETDPGVDTFVTRWSPVLQSLVASGATAAARRVS